MRLVKIFCEGVTDQIFIADCLEVLYGIETIRVPKKKDNKVSITFHGNGSEIIDVEGCSKLVNDLYIQIMKDTKELEGINIVIFDADYPADPNIEKKETGNNGFASCNQKLNNIKKQYNVDFEYLIWPNHSKDGEVEDLLRQLIPKNKEPIYHCIESHHECLNSLGIDNLRIAELKEKIRYYLYTSYQDSNARDRNYRNTNYWNLDFDSIDDLKRLKLFFDEYLLVYITE